MKFKNILCPTDFSDSARYALQVAEEMAGQFHARLHLLHVIFDVNVYSGAASAMTWYPSMYVDLERIAQDELKMLRASISKTKDVSEKIARGTESEQILQYARSHSCDLIVMGTHGRTGIERLILGSTTEQVVRHASCPVLTVRLPNN